MAQYFYSAKSFTGETRSGIIEAKDEYALARILRQKGYVLIKARLKEGKPKGKLKIFFPFRRGVSLTEKMMFTRNLHVMISAGVSLPRALKLLETQAKSDSLKKALDGVRTDVVKGKSFTESLAKYPNIFPELFIGMIKVGEETGTMENVLKILTRDMEREHELRSKILGALMYPAVIILAMLGIGVLMLVMVVPKLAQTFEELNVQLPVTTRFVIGVGTFMTEKWYLAIALLIAFLVFLKIVLKTKEGKKAVDILTLKLPIVSSLIKKTNSAYTIGTLSSLIDSGVPIVRALGIISGAIGNVYFKESVAEAAKEVQKGRKLSETLDPSHNLYPPLVTQMIQVGEETGRTADILAKLAEFFEEEVTDSTKRLSSIIEPIIMLMIGGAVGFFAISMIQPMYSMLQAM